MPTMSYAAADVVASVTSSLIAHEARSLRSIDEIAASRRGARPGAQNSGPTGWAGRAPDKGLLGARRRGRRGGGAIKVPMSMPFAHGGWRGTVRSHGAAGNGAEHISNVARARAHASRFRPTGSQCAPWAADKRGRRLQSGRRRLNQSDW